MERREFIKSACTLCAALSTGLLFGTLSSCAPYPVYETSIDKSKIIVPLSLFAKTNIQIIRAKKLGYDVALQKETDGSFSALLLRCTHAANPLKYTGNEFVCSLHGSTFSPEGKVIEGPATRSLRKMETIVSSDHITILIN
jgi:Rieske Fe-S protein